MNDYIEVINELEKIEEIVLPNKYKRCCYSLLELFKSLIVYIKLKSK